MASLAFLGCLYCRPAYHHALFSQADPHLIENRSKAGPRAESRPAQKLNLLVPFLFAALAARLIDEERFLLANLPGYSDYCLKVRHHIVPYVLVNSFFPSVRFTVAGVSAVDGWTLILRAHTFVVRL